MTKVKECFKENKRRFACHLSCKRLVRLNRVIDLYRALLKWHKRPLTRKSHKNSSYWSVVSVQKSEVYLIHSHAERCVTVGLKPLGSLPYICLLSSVCHFTQRHGNKLHHSDRRFHLNLFSRKYVYVQWQKSARHHCTVSSKSRLKFIYLP